MSNRIAKLVWGVQHIPQRSVTFIFGKQLALRHFVCECFLTQPFS
jgi:hypothetical protein